jgi:siroheme synthase
MPKRADRRGRHAVLAGAGLGDHALLAHALREQRLADHVVDLVRAGVVQVFALQVDLRAAEHLAPALRVIDRRRPADEVLELALVLGDESGSLRNFS